MSPDPTGAVVRTDTGIDLELRRTIRAPRDDVWASVTHSDRTALWFGPWDRTAADRITVRMRYEEGSPPIDLIIVACKKPARLAVTSAGESGSWHLELLLVEDGDFTVLTLVQHRTDTEGLGEIGPGWEYYLDLLIASRNGTPQPSFDEYYPCQRDYYAALIPE